MKVTALIVTYGDKLLLKMPRGEAGENGLK